MELLVRADVRMVVMLAMLVIIILAVVVIVVVWSFYGFCMLNLLYMSLGLEAWLSWIGLVGS